MFTYNTYGLASTKKNQQKNKIGLRIQPEITSPSTLLCSAMDQQINNVPIMVFAYGKGVSTAKRRTRTMYKHLGLK